MAIEHIGTDLGSDAGGPVTEVRLAQPRAAVAVHPDIELICEVPRVVLRKEVLNPTECSYLIENSRGKTKTAGVMNSMNGTAVDEDIRKSEYRVVLEDDNAIEKKIIDKIRRAIFGDGGTSFPVHINRYSDGGVFKAHLDALSVASGNEHLEYDRGSTSIVYLNDDYDGGETAFIAPQLAVKGRLGDIVTFDNFRDDGAVDFEALHAGLPVISGEKWVAVVWSRVAINGA